MTLPPFQRKGYGKFLIAFSKYCGKKEKNLTNYVVFFNLKQTEVKDKPFLL